MAEEEKKNRWEDRNIAVKTYKLTGKFGWMHLVIGQNKTTQGKFLRLKRYMNWFSIPDERYLLAVQNALQKGATELAWVSDVESTIKQVEVEKENFSKEVKNHTPTNIPTEVALFIEENPEFTKKLIALNIDKQNQDYFYDLLETIEEAIQKSGERFKTAFKEIVSKISLQDVNGMQELSDLMEKWNLFQITSLTNILKGRLDTIETFDRLIHDKKTYEINSYKSIHRILENNMWLIDENYWIVQSNKSLRTFIGDEIVKSDKQYSSRRPDFACVNPTGEKLVIVEIRGSGAPHNWQLILSYDIAFTKLTWLTINMPKQNKSTLIKPDYDEIRRVVNEEVKELLVNIVTGDQLKQAVSALPTKDEFYNKMDQVLGEVQGMRENNAAHIAIHDEIEKNTTNLTHKVKHLYKVFEINEPVDLVPSY